MLNHYFIRIQLLLARIATMSNETLRTNRPFVDHYNASWEAGYTVDQILAGVHKSIKDMDLNSQLFERFKPYIEDEESRMKKKLVALMYHIDAPNTLSLVTGSGRLEKVSITPCDRVKLSGYSLIESL